MANQAERQKAYRERKRAEGMKDRLYFMTDEQDQALRAFLETGSWSGEGVRIPEQWIKDKDRMAKIRERLARAEKRYRAKDGRELVGGHLRLQSGQAFPDLKGRGEFVV